MKQSQLNLKPIILTPIEACAFIGKAIIEHFVLLAGAYNLGFFIELAEYFIFFIFRIVVNVYKRETA